MADGPGFVAYLRASRVGSSPPGQSLPRASPAGRISSSARALQPAHTEPLSSAGGREATHLPHTSAARPAAPRHALLPTGALRLRLGLLGRIPASSARLLAALGRIPCELRCHISSPACPAPALPGPAPASPTSSVSPRSSSAARPRLAPAAASHQAPPAASPDRPLQHLACAHARPAGSQLPPAGSCCCTCAAARTGPAQHWTRGSRPSPGARPCTCTTAPACVSCPAAFCTTAPASPCSGPARRPRGCS
jgi:hypothetical protein